MTMLTFEGFDSETLTNINKNVLKTNDLSLGAVISTIIPLILFIAGVVLLFYIIIGGYKFLSSRGDPKSIEAGKTILVNATIGFIIIFISYWVVKLIGQTFGIEAILNIFN